jgi:hypothetical protein
MKIDLHIHTSTGSDGAMPMEEVFREAKGRCIEFISITDHDSIEHQGKAIVLAAAYKMKYVTGVELNITFSYNDKSYSLDFLGYGYDYKDKALNEKLRIAREHRIKRAQQIRENLNREFKKEKRALLTAEEWKILEQSVDGTLSRPHIADFLIKKGIVKDRQEAFDRYLVKCDVPKYPLHLEEASMLVRDAGGRLVHAHPNDPHGTSLVSISKDLTEQTKIIEKYMLKYIDGIECWHSRADKATTAHYMDFCKKHNLIMTGGSDCHQKPIVMGTVEVPEMVAEEFE